MTDVEEWEWDVPVQAARDNVNPIVIRAQYIAGVFEVTPHAIVSAPTIEPLDKLRRPGVVIPARANWRAGEEIAFSVVYPPNDFSLGTTALGISFGSANPATVGVTLSDDGQFWDPFVGYDLSDPEDEGRPRETFRDPPTRAQPVPLRIATKRIPGHLDDTADPPPFWPDPFYGLGGDRIGRAVYGGRKRREIWLSLVHRDGDATIAHDVALFTVAPVIFSCDIDTPRQLYAVFTPPGGDEFTYRPGNFDVIGALANLARDVGIDLVLDRTHWENSDQWAQDAYYMGYTHTPDPRYPVLYYPLRAIRRRQLGHGFPRTLDGHPVEQLRDGNFRASPDNSLDYGGNLVASPPVTEATDALGGGQAGAACDAHAPAPYGKLIYSESMLRRTSDIFLRFISSQVQPLVPINAAWLKVGHADEVVSFVPATSTCPATQAGRKGWAMLYASPDVALTLMHRVCANALRVERMPRDTAIMAPFEAAWHRDMERFIRPHLDHAAGNLAAMRQNREIPYMVKLDAIALRLKHCLAIEDADIVRVPVIFSLENADVTTLLPNMVNMQILGTVLAVPKPWGPRLSVRDCVDVLRGVEGIDQASINAVDWNALQRENVWIPRYHRIDRFLDDGCEYFESDLSGGLPPEWRVLPQLDNAPIAIPADWRHYHIVHRSVCVLEAYMAARLVPLGLRPVFIDDWHAYHHDVGDLHCGTKVLRRMPNIALGDEWWRHA